MADLVEHDGKTQMACGVTDEVVVVDDDVAVLDSFRFMLESAGFAVATYASAKAFLDRIPSTPRCLIVDQNMPVMTGLELAARLRAGGNAIPFLLVTSLPSQMLADRAAEIGILHVLPKPPAEEALLRFVNASRSCRA